MTENQVLRVSIMYVLYKSPILVIGALYVIVSLGSIAAHRDHFVWCLSVHLSVCLSRSHTFD